MEIYVARQPVFTARKEIFGYELLFRQGLKNAFPGIDGSNATSRVLSNTFFTFRLNDILGDKPGLINFTRDLLLKKTPLLFPKSHIIIEVLEDIEPDREIVKAIEEFRNNGFRIALDDFAYEKKYDALIRFSDIIKFDLLATPLSTLEPVLAAESIAGRPLTLLAEKVETYEEFEQARQMGFGLFQGYFFSKPEILSHKGLSANQITQLKLLNAINSPDMDMDRIEDLIKKDVSISFKLLKFINAAYFKRPNPVNTIRDAVTLLGVDELKKFIHVVAVSDMNPDKPDELLRSSLVRARMCELCGTLLKTRFTTDELFTIGLFSSMDALMDMPMEVILSDVSFSDPIKSALLGEDNQFRQLSTLVSNYEKGAWNHRIFKLLQGKKLLGKLPEFYLDAVKMAQALSSPL